MTSLQLVQAPLNMSSLGKWAAARGVGWPASRQAERLTFDEGAALHHLLVEMFGKGSMQPFRVFVAPGSGSANLYAYSPHTADALRDAAGSYALPDTISVLDPGTIASKTMPATWTTNRRLGFDVRVRPIRRLASELDSFAKGAEIDTFLAEALRRFPDAKGSTEGMLAAGRSREVVYLEWLSERFGDAATLENGRVVAFERRPVVRHGRLIDGPDAIIHGNLSVRDSARFLDLLRRGIGRHAAYGYGMLLLRPPGS
jgi:CRISPR system Cascade subunit CasE